MRTPPRRRMILRDWRKHEFGRDSASPPILRRSEEAANIKQENPNRAKVVNGSTWTGFFLIRLTDDQIYCVNLPDLALAVGPRRSPAHPVATRPASLLSMHRIPWR